MSTTSHTPGPWILRPSQYQLPGSYQVTTSGSPLTIGFVCHDIPAGEANARLIAAAPELLKELEDLTDCLTRIAIPRADLSGWIASARAAIAKAKAQPLSVTPQG